MESAFIRNLVAEMERLGFNNSSLARAAGLGPDAIRDLRRGQAKQLSGEKLDAVARVLGRTPGQLLGTEPMTDDGTVPPLTRLPPETVKDQAKLQLLRYWDELSRKERRLLLTIAEACATDDD